MNLTFWFSSRFLKLKLLKQLASSVNTFCLPLTTLMIFVIVASSNCQGSVSIKELNISGFDHATVNVNFKIFQVFQLTDYINYIKPIKQHIKVM